MTKIKLPVFLFMIFISFTIDAESFNEKQLNIRIQKPVSLYTGINSISNYYYVPYGGISYNFRGNTELGFLFINSKYNFNYDPKFYPSSQSVFNVQEFDLASQNSAKIFVNYYLFNSILFVNASFGYLPSISSGIKMNSIFDSSSIGPGYSYLSIEMKKLPSYYLSPGLGMKISLENGIFVSITGGPMFLQKNRTELILENFLTTNSTEANISSNLLLNLPIIKNSYSGFGKNTEAYIDVAAGYSF